MIRYVGVTGINTLEEVFHIQFANADIQSLLKPDGHECQCGRHHKTGVRRVVVKPGALASLPSLLQSLGYHKPFIVCDDNTYQAAGKQAMQLLSAADITFSSYRFPKTHRPIEPDEHAVGSLVMSFDPQCDVVVAVGSGVINDCCKVLAHAAGKPMAIVATAPSMDGYASNSSSMIQNRMKVTLYNACPALIVADVDILRNAPMEMLLAGLGDMLAKNISLCEWRISHLITGEYYCDNIADLVRASLMKCMASAEGLISRDPAAITAIFEGLTLSGIAMSFAEISRPASGLEHYFSHLFEMMALDRGEPSSLHGLQVGVGTLITLKLLERLATEIPDWERAEKAASAFSQPKWEDSMRDIFGKAADNVIEAEKIFRKNDMQKRQERMQRIITYWPEVQKSLQDLPKPVTIRMLMATLGMPISPSDLGISLDDVRKAYIGSREIRDKYLTSSMLWDMGLLEAYAPTE